MIFAVLKWTAERQLFAFFQRISRKLASTFDYSALLSKETVKYLSFLFEICNVIIIINWWITRYFFNCDLSR